MLTAGLPGTGGRIRETPDDFVVEEIPAYDPCGSGEHVYVLVRKRGLTTDEAARRLARRAGVRPMSIGFAGRKDKHAVTTQWFSISGTDPEALRDLSEDGLEVLRVDRHGNKLRPGHLRGNRFRIVVRGAVPEAPERARAILGEVAERGLPNSFGPQRQGGGGHNTARALAWIRDGGRPPRDKGERRLLVSALQADLFNRVVERRIEAGSFASPLLGDVAKLHTTGGMFVVEDPAEVGPRVRAGEVSPTGPIYGARMWWPTGDALLLEERVLEEAGLTREHLDRYRSDGRGSRRPLRVFPWDVEVAPIEGGLELRFCLEAGAFATTLLHEVTKEDVA